MSRFIRVASFFFVLMAFVPVMVYAQASITGVVRDPGEVIQIPLDRLREIVEIGRAHV